MKNRSHSIMKMDGRYMEGERFGASHWARKTPCREVACTDTPCGSAGHSATPLWLAPRYSYGAVQPRTNYPVVAGSILRTPREAMGNVRAPDWLETGVSIPKLITGLCLSCAGRTAEAAPASAWTYC